VFLPLETIEATAFAKTSSLRTRVRLGTVLLLHCGGFGMANRSRTIRFGAFEADLESQELRKHGIRLKVQAQPFRVLAILLERPGEVVSREELQRRLWLTDTFTDFDHGLNKAVNKLREALGDSREMPRYIETLAKRGYRFVAPVLLPEADPQEAGEAPAMPAPSLLAGGSSSKAWWVPVVAVIAVLLIAASIEALRQKHSHAARPHLAEAAPAANLTQPRGAHATVALLDGTVLVAGGLGEGYLRTSEVYVPALARFVPAGSMQEPRDAPGVLLRDGSVLIAGGYGGGTRDLDSAEIFDPRAATFSPVGRMSLPRTRHSAILLADGRVFVSGGSHLPEHPPDPHAKFLSESLRLTELFDPRTRQFTSGPDLLVERAAHTSTQLAHSGDILLAGGLRQHGPEWSYLTSAELYRPAENRILATGSMSVPRSYHTATLLRDGRVLVVGGYSTEKPGPPETATAELYDPDTKSFSVTGSLHRARFAHTATLLPDGRVVIVGGYQGRCCRTPEQLSVPLASIEIYDPATRQFTEAGQLLNARAEHSAVLMSDGSVLIIGGTIGKIALATAEVVRVAGENAQAMAAPVITSVDRQ
jgi:DNA-binding winged helix-turn-helix (wHTH) protein